MRKFSKICEKTGCFFFKMKGMDNRWKCKIQAIFRWRAGIFNFIVGGAVRCVLPHPGVVRKAGFINSLNNVKKAQAIDIVGQLLYSTTGSQALPLTACRRLLITEGCPRTQRFNNHWVYKLIVIKKYRESLKMLFRKIAVSQTKDFLYIRRYSKHWDYSIDIAITMQILYIIVL